MTDHPITPPPELVAKWASSMCGYYEAARWGADQELDACANWLTDPCAADMPSLAKDLRYSRRPKPPSLKEQALALVDRHEEGYWRASSVDWSIIRRALEQLDD